MPIFKITVKHDNGRKTIRTAATDEATARQIVCNFENAPLSAVRKVVRVWPKIKSIDIVAKEWFDKVNGNSYFAAQVVINQDYPHIREIIHLPFQYGYGDFYEHAANEKLHELGVIKNPQPRPGTPAPALWSYCRDRKIHYRRQKYENCLQRDVKQWGNP